MLTDMKLVDMTEGNATLSKVKAKKDEKRTLRNGKEGKSCWKGGACRLKR